MQIPHSSEYSRARQAGAVAEDAAGLVRPVVVCVLQYGVIAVPKGFAEGDLCAAIRRQVAEVQEKAYRNREVAGGPVVGGTLDVLLPTFRDPYIRRCYARFLKKGADRSWKRHRHNRWGKTAIVSMVGVL